MSVDVDALLAMTVEKGIPLEKLLNSIEQTVTESYAELPEAMPQGRAVLNRQNGEILIHVPQFDGEGVYTETITHMPEGFESKIKSVVRKVLKEKMRASNDAGIVAEFTGSVGDIISGIVQQGRDVNIIYVDLGKVEGKIPLVEQVPTEHYKHGDRIKAYVVDVRQGEKGPEVTLSRTHPLFVKMLFTLEVPELKDNVVEIVGVSREAGQRSKVSVRSHRAGVSPKGALIGPVGARAKAVMDELHGEKIDIVDFSEDPATYVASALAPARVSSVEIVDLLAKSAKVIVPDYQLSLAIGKDGQNVRLAVKLTGWRMDIHPDNPVERLLKPSDIAKAEAAAEAAAALTLLAENEELRPTAASE
ncbi:MAG: transcription termination factor NusA [Actinomycetes bacterium]|jgi:transcription termination/antitermination protein NusA